MGVVTELLNGVCDIDWSSLRHAYGSAERVPRWLAAMTDPATSAKALDELDTAGFAPLVRGAVEQDERLLDSGGWRGIVEDEQARALAAQALTAISARPLG
jgi:hypothetical protein